MYQLIYLSHIDIIFVGMHSAKEYYNTHKSEFSSLADATWVAFDDSI